MSFLRSLRPPSVASGESDEDVRSVASSSGPPKDVWKLEEVESRKRVREELGDPQQRKECFGCVYDLSTEGVHISREDFRQLCLVASKCIGQMSLEAYGKEIARLYEEFREKTNSKGLHEDRDPLPPWSAASIVEHMCHHNVDPEIQTWVRLIEIQEMIAITMTSIVEYNQHGQKRINDKAAATYERLVKTWYFVSSRQLDKHFAFRKNAKIDVDSINQPIVTQNQKSIIDYYVEAQGPYIRRG